MSGMSVAGLGTGVQKGLQYDLQFFREFSWAIKTNNRAALLDLEAIGAAHGHEIAGGAADVTESHAVAILFMSDPFKGSRQMMHDFEAKYGKH